MPLGVAFYLLFSFKLIVSPYFTGDGEREGLHGECGGRQQKEGQVQRRHVLPDRDGASPQGPGQPGLEIL